MNIKIIIVLTVLFFNSCGQFEQNKILEFHGSTMGTNYSVKIIDIPSLGISISPSDLKDSLNILLEQVNNQMSTWIENSEISVFNSSESTDWFEISQDFLNVLSIAQLVGQKSNGAFDVTVEPLVNLWGFGPDYREHLNVPDPKDIQLILQEIGWDKIVIDSNNSRIMKTHPTVSCDLSAIAKGFGVDKISAFIESIGYENYLVEIGGEIRVNGRNNNGQDWGIGISKPDGSFDVERVIKVTKSAMATSGDYRNYFEVDGKRFSHTIDPRTGNPITHNLVSVTVISDDCTTADAYATAINVLGPYEGLKFAEKENLAVFLIVKIENEYEEIFSSMFEKYLN